ncbi:PLP-dependent aminotransferase family protein [Solicola sp. PLA-1-18]|uniref:MocR-like transcription factor YczR n=1 Tax=Solicola sp. PLA-1-18 TaxID=3380532 RepID=UPI003B7F84A9
MIVATVSASRLRDLLGLTASDSPGYRALSDAVRLLVAEGGLAPRTRLPSERELTAALAVSRTTVTRAYADLRDAGYLVSRRGSGSVVSLPGSRGTTRVAPVPEALGLHTDDSPDGSVLAWTIASSRAVPGVGRACARAVEALPAYLGQSGYHLAGVPALREAIARRYDERGLPTDPDQVVVTAGAQAGWTLLMRSLARPGDRVLLDSPTYPNAAEGVRQGGLRPLGVPLDGAGWDVEALASTVRASRPTLAYLLPDFHNPTGALMDDGTRERLGRVLARSATTAVVDETMLDLSLDVEEADLPLPFAAHDPSAVTVGSASKSFWGGLRIGWVRAPHDVARLLLQRRSATDLGASLLDQLVVAELLADRDVVLAEQRSTLRAGRARLESLLADHLPDWRPNHPSGGMALWTRLPERRSTSVVAAAERQGLLLTSGPRFFVGPGGEQHLRLPFSRTPEHLDESVRRLATAWSTLDTPTPHPRAVSMTA